MSSQAYTLGEARPARGRGVRGSLVARQPALARMLLAGFISSSGDRLNQVALAAMILGLTGSMISAGLVFVVSTLPYVLFGLPMGALVDRWNRRTTMVLADLARAGLVSLIPLAASVSLALVYPLLFAMTCATMAFAPSRQAAVPDLVGEEDLANANSLFQAANYLVDLLAYPLAGLMVAGLIERLGTLSGTQVAFSLDALSYLASAALIMRLRLDQRAVARARVPLAGLLGQVREGLSFLRQNASVRTNTILLTIGPLMLGSLHTLWIGFAWRVSNTGTFGYGVVETCNAIGTLLGLLLLRQLTPRMRAGRLVLLGLATMGGAVTAAGLTSSLPVVAILSAASGTANMLFLVPSVTMVQRHTPTELRGRVFSVRLMLTYAAFSASNAVAGGLSDVIGVSTLLCLLGSGMLALALSASFVRSAREAT
ncbi:MAG: MFS transporter [Chloroflexota bacterium]|nr:MFS transporter [Chloroflexota bacterium]